MNELGQAPHGVEQQPIVDDILVADLKKSEKEVFEVEQMRQLLQHCRCREVGTMVDDGKRSKASE